MHRKLRELQPALVNREGPLLLPDNACPLVLRITMRKSNELALEVLPHSPYPTDLKPTDYHLFKKLILEISYWRNLRKSGLRVIDILPEPVRTNAAESYWDEVDEIC